jgi:hypothetical protein
MSDDLASTAIPEQPAVGNIGEERIMTVPSLLNEPGRADEPRTVEEYSEVFTQVAAERRPMIVRHNGEELAPNGRSGVFREQ